MIQKEWNPKNWTCTDRDALEQLVGEVEEQDEEAQIDWELAIIGGKVDTRKVNSLTIERDFNSRLESGEFNDLESYKRFVIGRSKHFKVEFLRGEQALRKIENDYY